MNLLKKIYNRFTGIQDLADLTKRESTAIRLLTGKMLANTVKQHGIYANLQDAEFKVFSQFGDDGILQYLIHQTKPEKLTFIEFGVQDYAEANTRFLLINDNWSGLIIDGNAQAMASLQKEEFYWRHDLTATGAFITRDNVNELFIQNGFRGDVGLLSIDIDGNDYWVWEAIHSVNPVLVTVEYNSVFGAEHAITIPYDPAFYRTKAHPSNLYWGASLKALCLLAEKKGYVLVGCNSAGNNAHFVRKDKVGGIPIKSPKDSYVESKFRESRDQNGQLTFMHGKERLEIIKHLEVFDLESNSTVLIKSLIS